MAKLEDLQAKRAAINAEIQKRGGDAKAPGYAKQLKDIETQIRTVRGDKPGDKQNDGKGSINLPTKIGNVDQGVEAEIDTQRLQAGDNQKYGNANEVNPFGSKEVTYGPDGTATVTTKLSDDQQGIVDKDADISNIGRERALQLAGQGGLDKSFTPELQARVGSGDLIADRQRQEQDLSAYLGRDLDTNYAKQKQDLEQTLYNRGIPLDPNNQQYQDQMKVLDDNFSRQRGDVRAQALQFGGQEMDRTFGQNEQVRANQLAEQSGIRNQNLGEINQWSNAGTGAQIPSFQGYQGAQVNYGSPNEIGLGLTAARQNAQQLKIAQQAANKVGGGGGGRAATPPVAASPFVEG